MKVFCSISSCAWLLFCNFRYIIDTRVLHRDAKQSKLGARSNWMITQGCTHTSPVFAWRRIFALYKTALVSLVMHIGITNSSYFPHWKLLVVMMHVCHRWWQSWHHDKSWFSVLVLSETKSSKTVSAKWVNLSFDVIILCYVFIGSPLVIDIIVFFLHVWSFTIFTGCIEKMIFILSSSVSYLFCNK